jgi:integral membrane protein (TIGR00529 family)
VDALKLGAVFVVILVLVARRYNLGAVMLVGGALLAVAFAMPPDLVARTVGGTLSTWTTWQLTIALVAIVVLEHALREWGALRRLSAGLLGLVRDERLVMAALPALIGFLPSAGGARFSAPLVDEVAASTTATPAVRSFANYWFRHVWNYSIPVYAGVVLVSAVAAVPLSNVIVANLPLTVAALAAGVIVAFPQVHAVGRAPTERGVRGHLADLAPGLVPILAVLVAVVAFHVDVALALVVAAVCVVVAARIPFGDVGRVLRSPATIRIATMVLGVLVFKDVLAASGAVTSIPALLEGAGVPLLVVAFVVPLVVGFVTALETAFVGLTFPLLLAITGTVDLKLLAFAYASGFAGVMLSPLHLCMIFTREYFQTEYVPILGPVAIATLGVLVTGLAIVLT